MKTQVLIVGGGPAGLSASLLLSRLGVPSLLIERRLEGSTLPRAHIVNHRTMEIFRELGLEDAVRKGSTPPEHIEFVVCTGLGGEIIARTRSWGDRPDAVGAPHDFSPCRVMNHSQDGLEALLRKAAEEEPLGSIAFGHDLVALRQEADRVLATVRHSSGNTLEIEADYVLGCDGARSLVRTAADIAETGMSGHLSILYAHFRANLRELWRKNPGVLYTIFNDQLRGAGLVLMREPDEWIFSLPLVPPMRAEDVSDPDYLTQLIRKATGLPALEPEIVRTSPWELGAVVADRFRNGRMFLCGDAAHRMPPASGLGMNSALHDTHNLCWKIAAVLQGTAGPALLDSYERERRPAAQRNTYQSLANALKLMAIEQAVGLTFESTPADVAALSTELVADTPAGEERRRQVAAAVDAMHDMTDALGIDLGIEYALQDPPAEFNLMNLPDPRLFEDSGAPGRRVPHAWLDNSTSTLDLVGRGRFVLLCGPEARLWNDAMSTERGVAIETVDGEACTGWLARSGLGPDGALLVRPDGYVAWRSSSRENPDEGPAEALQRARGCEPMPTAAGYSVVAS